MTQQLTSVADVFDVLSTWFDPDAATGLSATYQFDLVGDAGGTYHVSVDDGQCEVGIGAAERPNITITMTASDYLDMINGLLNPQVALLGGKLKIKGDMGLAVKMQELFPAN
jgi:putative sterol carrier protein